MKGKSAIALTGLGLLALATAATIHAADFEPLSKVEKQGVVVELAVEKVVEKGDADVASQKAEALTLRAGDNVRFRFRAYDTASRSPLSGAFPAAWVHPRPAGDSNDELSCQDKIKTFIGGSLFSRAEIDLNTYYVLVLNDDATISVVDPLFGFGGSKLLTMLRLPAIGYDWVKNARQSHVFVSVPATDQIVKIDTVSWATEIVRGGKQWQRPMKLVLQHDQRYLWAVVNQNHGEQGVAVFDPETMALEKLIVTGDRVIDLTLSSDGRFVFVLNAGSETVSVIDTNKLEVITTLTLGKQPVAMDYSALAETLYISHREDGQVIAIDGARHYKVAEITSEPGSGKIRFSPDGRWGFLVNPRTHHLSIIDASKNRIVQSSVVERIPEDISFSDNLAYIRHRGSSTLLMITLDDDAVGREGARIPAVDTTGGDHPPGLIDVKTAAPGIIQAPGSNAVLIANYHDKAVYFYKEGMAAPMGQFSNYGRSPRSVMAVDRSLREIQQPGIYETAVTLPSAGVFDVIYFMDSPRIIHCFSLRVEPQYSLAGESQKAQLSRVDIIANNPDAVLAAGTRAHLEYQISLPDSFPDIHQQKIDVLITLASGIWRERQALPFPEDGMLRLNFTPPAVGYYRIAMQWQGFGDSDKQPLAEFIYQTE